MVILIDNGHGENTSGKHSPDYRLKEYKYNREIARALLRRLCALGFNAIQIVPEEDDIKISERVRRVNGWCKKYGASNVMLISIHVNAAGGDGKWHNARGWLSIVDDNASAASKMLAEALYDEIAKRGLKTRQPMFGKKFYLYSEALGKSGVRLPILRDTACPAVLTENFFQDNLEDVEFLLSDQGKEAIIGAHIDAIIRINSLLTKK